MHAFYDSVGDYLQVAAPARTLIVEDEDMNRERVHALLERTGEVEIVGERVDGVEAVRRRGR